MGWGASAESTRSPCLRPQLPPAVWGLAVTLTGLALLPVHTATPDSQSLSPLFPSTAPQDQGHREGQRSATLCWASVQQDPAEDQPGQQSLGSLLCQQPRCRTDQKEPAALSTRCDHALPRRTHHICLSPTRPLQMKGRAA